MRSMLIGCCLLVAGSCAAFAQQDPTPAQGGSPNAPAPAPMSTAAPGDQGMMMKKPMMHHGMMHHGRMMHHKKMMMHRKMMMHHKRMMMHHKHMMQKSM